MSSLPRAIPPTAMFARSLTALSVVLGCASAPPPPPAVPRPPAVEPSASPDASSPVDAAAAPSDALAPPPETAALEPTPTATPLATPLEPTPTATPLATPAAAEPVRMFRGRSEDEWLRLMTERPAVRVLGHFHSTLHVYHLDLGDGIEVSFQPEQTNLESFWRREVTSYHLARVLGIEHRVPPTIGKRVPLSVFGRSARGVRLVVDRHGMVLGSASVWMPVLHGAQMHLDPARAEWSSWVNPAIPLPAGRRERARQVSEVLVFDYLAANYDRWNCCNITVDENNDLVFRDNDAGWLPRVINTLGSPGVVRRVPRYLYESIQRATPEVLRASVAHDPLAREIRLVDPDAYVGYDRRRRALIANLRRMVTRYGESAVLAWP